MMKKVVDIRKKKTQKQMQKAFDEGDFFSKFDERTKKRVMNFVEQMERFKK